MAQIVKTKYVHPEVLVDTQWVENHLEDKKVRIVEVDYDSKSNYDLGHIPYSALIDWKKDVNDPITRDILNINEYEKLLQKIGIENDSTVILYGDFNNWFAAFAFWVFKYYGYKDVRLLDGGRKKWLEEDRQISKDIVKYPKSNFKLTSEIKPDTEIRALLGNVKDALVSRRSFQLSLVDVRSRPEYKGEITAPPEYPTEGAQRGGHIPGAVNIPWSQVISEDGTFKSLEEISKIYEKKGVTKDKDIITYCRIGERSSHTWFVLKYLLGYPNVKNYDGSWTEWGNLIGNPIENGDVE
ncbi:MAG TPA: sulfurtransferase [Nitrososphaeraceae archaeon]|nr:sulfurtransferase [Nitrososphaeraceae archaeon]